ncbi:ABC transporter permease [Robbsia andropogonis]|uniref:ABC transporter permease n=1 Tax=Robbsia andropogonis TaxID=28092 RepID=UPI00344CFA28
MMMGIAAVVLMLAVGAGARNKQLEEIRSYGVDATYVMPGASASDSRRTAIETLTKNDADALRLLPDVVGVSAMSTFSGEVVRGATKIDATVYGVDADYFDASVRRFRDGRMFGSGAISKQSAVAVIDAQGYQTLFPQGGPAIGQRILVAKVPVTIIGILEDEDNGIPGNGLELYMPITAVQGRLNGRWHADFLRLSLRPGVSVDAAEAAISATLLARHRRKDFHLMSFTKYIEIQKRTARTMGIVMLVSAAIALSIGGIGVMNMMLVAVRERVAEIGIRLAVGAARADIARQFLLEALLICLIGGVAGVGLSLAVASIMQWAAPSLPLQPTATSLIGACLGSIVIGITFGLLPARQAARMDPIAGLTHG